MFNTRIFIYTLTPTQYDIGIHKYKNPLTCLVHQCVCTEISTIAAAAGRATCTDHTQCAPSAHHTTKCRCMSRYKVVIGIVAVEHEYLIGVLLIL